MDPLIALRRGRTKYVIGLMSGTSADGIDAALVRITGSGVGTRVRQLAFQTVPYPRGFHRLLMRGSDGSTARIDDITRLNILLGVLFADAARRIARLAGFSLRDVDLIGSHGQTIHHLPVPVRLFGRMIRGTLQIGDPSVIAKEAGVVTVGDFRTGDIGVGGSGAPLVPYVDYLLFRSRSKNRALLNIGGIANITVIPKSSRPSGVVASDTGPGNMVVDGLMRHYFGRSFDRDGELAAGGRILTQLLRKYMRHPFLHRKPPKSTGREMFGERFLRQWIGESRGHRVDSVTTATEFTALTVYHHYMKFIRPAIPVDELIVSGGGVHNRYLMNALHRYFDPVPVTTVEDHGWSSDAKEAVAFAVLANETIAGHAGNLPGATGAKRRTVLGKICYP